MKNYLLSISMTLLSMANFFVAANDWKCGLVNWLNVSAGVLCLMQANQLMRKAHDE